MKKLILAIVIISSLMVGRSYAQNVPNAGFENWVPVGSSSNPTSWDTPNAETSAIPLVGFSTVTKLTSGAHGGSFAAKLQSKSMLTQVIPGVMTLGNLTINLTSLSFSLNGGAPISTRPASLTGFYQFTPVSGDTCAILVMMYKHNALTGLQDTIGLGFFMGDTAKSSWTPFSAGIQYFSAETPDTINVIILSSASMTGHANTILLVDDLALDYTTGISDPLVSPEQFVWWDYTSQTLMVRYHNEKEENMKVRVFNAMGQIVKEQNLGMRTTGTELIPIEHLPHGLYLVEVTTGIQKQTTKMIF